MKLQKFLQIPVPNERSCGWKLRVPFKLRVDLGDPLVSRQGRQMSFGIEMGTSGFLELRCRDK